MAKKVSKHSRAARRLEAEEPEAKSLADLPRAEKTDLTSTMIRTASKNEALLNAKMNKRSRKDNKIGKKQIQKNPITTMDKERLERALNFTSRLDGKIEKAISKAKYVQNARKAGWDSTNQSIKREIALLQDTNASDTKPAEDVGDATGDIEEEKEVEAEKPLTEASNAFSALMDDVEA